MFQTSFMYMFFFKNRNFSLFLVCYKWVLDFIKCFFCIDMIMWYFVFWCNGSHSSIFKCWNNLKAVFLYKISVSGVPNTAPRCSDFLGGLTDRTKLYSQLRVIAKGYEAKLAKGKGAWGKAQRKLRESFQESFSYGVRQDVPNSTSTKLWQHVWNVVY